MSNTGTLDLTPGPWLAVSPRVRGAFIRAAVEIATEYGGNDAPEEATLLDYWRAFDEVFGNGQVGDWPPHVEGREVVAAVVDRAQQIIGRSYTGPTVLALTLDGWWDCARAALIVASGVIA